MAFHGQMPYGLIRPPRPVPSVAFSGEATKVFNDRLLGLHHHPDWAGAPGLGAPAESSFGFSCVAVGKHCSAGSPSK